MRFRINKTIGMYALYLLAMVCAAITFFFFLKNVSFFIAGFQKALGILGPFIWGFAFAYLFLRPLAFIEGIWERYVFKRTEKHTAVRAVSILTLLVLVVLFLYIVSSIVFPQLLESVDTLRKGLPGYISSMQKMVNDVLSRTGLGKDINSMIAPYWSRILEASTEIFSSVLMFLVNSSVAFTGKVLNVFLIFVVTIYVMFGKEKFGKQAKKLAFAFLPAKLVKKLLFVLHLTDDIFGRYASGQLIDALLVGTLCAVSMAALKLPYPMLVGVIVACTNVIPMLGPIIGAVPGTFIILMAGKPIQALTFVILIFIIQQIDGNILVPRIVGGSTGLSGFWVIFAIMVGGGFFGVMGVVLCVPTLSVLFRLLKLWAEGRLHKKGLPVETDEYGPGMEPLEQEES